MAAGGFRTFVAGEVLDENDINNYLMQGMLVFADSTARASAIASPEHGQISFLTSSDTIEFYDGSAWTVLDTAPSTPTATGGTEVTSGGYKYHVFTSSADLVVTDDGLFEFLVLGGGGGGGNGAGDVRAGGGGGSSAAVLFDAAYLPAGTASIVIGAGASGGSRSIGGTSRINSTYIVPGGGYGGNFDVPGGVGSSAGGAGCDDTGPVAGGTAIPGYGGYNGGTGNNFDGGGGGAGSGANGANGSNNTGGNGGAGTTTYSTWVSAISSSMAAGWISATSGGNLGGGGGGAGGSTQGSGGAGGGANAGDAGSNGVANTSGGGGGARLTTGGNGGSGIVIARYAV